jgi:peptide/nickel transport system permease protein
MSTGLDLIPVKPTTAIVGAPSTKKATASKWFRLLVNDRVAAVAAVILAFVFLTAIFGPMLIGDLGTKIDLIQSGAVHLRTAGPTPGTDPLGRLWPVVACQTTLSVAIPPW